jgi:hypothetical protein
MPEDRGTENRLLAALAHLPDTDPGPPLTVLVIAIRIKKNGTC